jgi:hypothetical protein
MKGLDLGYDFPYGHGKGIHIALETVFSIKEDFVTHVPLGAANGEFPKEIVFVDGGAFGGVTAGAEVGRLTVELGFGRFSSRWELGRG